VFEVVEDTMEMCEIDRRNDRAAPCICFQPLHKNASGSTPETSGPSENSIR